MNAAFHFTERKKKKMTRNIIPASNTTKRHIRRMLGADGADKRRA